MYFPLKRKEIKAKAENDNVDTLSKVVKDLQDELKRKNEQEQVDKNRIDSLEEKQDILKDRVINLEKEIKNNDMAFSAITMCSYYKKVGKCPIINKKNESKKAKCSIEDSSQKKNGCKKGRYLRRK